MITIKDTSIVLNSSNIQLSTKGAGNSTTLKPTIVGQTKKVVWESADKSIATVSNGKVIGKSGGTTTITATANGLSSSCSVTVIDGKTNTAQILSDNTKTEIIENDVSLTSTGDQKTYQLNYEVIGKSSSVKWKSSNNAIVSVSATGKLTAKKTGSTTISLTANGITDTVNILVSEVSPSISLNVSDYQLFTKGTTSVTLKPTVIGKNKSVTWSSSNSNVAIVKGGKVTAKGAGTATITATANGVSADCVVTVYTPQIYLSQTSVLLSKGDNTYLACDFLGANQSVNWKSSNTKIATVSSGKVVAKNNGECDITATANGVKSVCKIIVNDCNHSFDAGVITKEANCVRTGERTYTCIYCGATKSEETTYGDHHYDDGTIITDATCTANGSKLVKCIDCGSTKEIEVAATGHNFGEWAIEKEATYTEEGSKKHICTLCNLEESETIEMLACQHNYEVVNEVPSTCCVKGSKTYKCSQCGDSYDEELELIAHNYTKIIVPETCTLGKWSYHECEFCGDIKDTEDDLTKGWLPALGHQYETVITKKATDTEDGLLIKTCSRCGDIAEESFSKTNHEHSYVNGEVIDLGGYGYDMMECKFCGDSYSGFDGKYRSLVDWYEFDTKYVHYKIEKGVEFPENIADMTDLICDLINEINSTDFDWKYEGHRIDAIISMDSLLGGSAGQNCILIGYRAFFYDNETDGAVTLMHELSHVMEISFEGCKSDPFITEGFANYTVYRIAKYVNENNIECLKNVCSYIEHSKIYTQDYKTATIFDKELIEWMTISRNQEKGASLVYVFGPYLWAYLDMEYDYHDLLACGWRQYLPEEAIEMLIGVYGQEAIDNFYPWLCEHPEVIEMFNQY